MPHVEHCGTCFCWNHIGNVVLLVAKAFVKLWQLAVACLVTNMLWEWTALHWAAYNGHTAVVETLLLSGSNLEARDNEALYNTLICL